MASFLQRSIKAHVFPEDNLSNVDKTKVLISLSNLKKTKYAFKAFKISKIYFFYLVLWFYHLFHN